MLSIILTILFVIFAGLGLIISIMGLSKSDLFITFEQKWHKKIFKKDFNPNTLTNRKIKGMSLILICITIILLMSYISRAIFFTRLG